MARRPRKQPNVYQRSDGRWEARATIEGRRKSFYGDTQDEALEERRKALERASAGIKQPSAQLKLNDYAEMWLRDVAPMRLAPATVRLYNMVYTGTWKPLLGDKSLIRITKIDVQQAVSQLQKELKPSTVKRWLSCLRGIFNHAIDMSLMSVNPTHEVTIPRIKKKEFPEMSDEDLIRIIDAIEKHSHGPLLGTMLFAGLRIGETLGLRRNDIDFAKKTITVDQAVRIVDSATNEKGLGDPKTETSKRVVWMMPELEALLKKQRATVATIQLKTGPEWNPLDLVFPTVDGTFINEATIRKALRLLCDDLGLDLRTPKGEKVDHLTPHMLRHLNTTLMSEAGINPRLAADLLGHSDTSTTLDVYTHSRRRSRQYATEAMSSYLQRLREGKVHPDQQTG